MSKKQKKNLARIGVAAVLFLAGFFLPKDTWIYPVVLLAAYAIIGWDILWRALRNITRGQVFDENFLMAVATIGALALGDFSEGVAVMLFYQVGEWFQDYAVGRSRKSIAALMDIRPDHANLRLEDGTTKQVDPEEVAVGQLVVVKPGERVPLDGIVKEGSSALDTSALTGESAPRDVAVGAEVISGCINLSGVLLVEVKKVYGESTVARILELVENSGSKKAKTEQFITRFARWYTPIVCVAALILAVVPPLVTGQPFGPWIYRALTFLVISCPCALVISVPLSFFGGIGGASKQGVLIKGGNYLEALAKADTVVFDKTGTLTKGTFAASETYAVNGDKAGLLETAALVELYSDHPIAQSVKAAYGGALDEARVADAGEEAGHGVHALVDGKRVLAGNAALMGDNGITPQGLDQVGTVIHLAVDGAYAGWILVEDVVKPDAAQAIKALKKMGVAKTVMLTGDADAVGQKVGKQLGLDEIYTQLLPQDKVEKVEALLAAEAENKSLLFVGDGVNDAPVLARADVGVAMGGLGSDAAIEAADVVIMTDEPSKVANAVGIGRKTMTIVYQNIVFALGIKAVVLVLGALGLASMWAAVFADVGVSVIAILNSMRALRLKG
ncbi:cadmium-translocating P-type ATPase [Clostridia bacterium OttesenSCG-928-O13]|nr:cadmium-translocating P-type ATPase [Clostridia bacterium OttesenSCG-928-O13]